MGHPLTYWVGHPPRKKPTAHNPCRGYPPLVTCGPGQRYDGEWKGKTSQGGEFNFTIEDGAITWYSLDWTLKLETRCAVPGSTGALYWTGGTAADLLTKPQGLSRKGFTLHIVGLGETAEATIAGAFASGSAASGEVDVRASSSGCRGGSKVTWTASRAGPAKWPFCKCK